MKKIKILLFAILVLAFAISVNAANEGILTISSITLNNNTIIGGTDTGSTATLVTNYATRQNYTIGAIYYNTTSVVWAKATLAGISGNSTCANNNCNHSTSGRGAMKVTITIPSDVSHSFFKMEVNTTVVSTSGGTPINRTMKLTVDSTSPVLTFVDPTPAQNARRDNGSWTINMTTGENVTSCTVTKEPNTVVNTATLANSDQAGWVAYTSQAAARFSFSATCLDYAADGANSGSTSENRIIQKASDPSPLTEEVLGTTTGTGTTFATKKKTIIVIAVVIVVLVSVLLLVMAMNGKKRRRRR